MYYRISDEKDVDITKKYKASNRSEYKNEICNFPKIMCRISLQPEEIRKFGDLSTEEDFKPPDIISKSKEKLFKKIFRKRSSSLRLQKYSCPVKIEIAKLTIFKEPLWDHNKKCLELIQHIGKFNTSSAVSDIEATYSNAFCVQNKEIGVVGAIKTRYNFKQVHKKEKFIYEAKGKFKGKIFNIDNKKRCCNHVCLKTDLFRRRAAETADKRITAILQFQKD